MGISACEAPDGLSSEAGLLERLARVPSIGKANCYTYKDAGVLIQVQLSQRNLAANSQRKYTKQLLVPDVSSPSVTVLGSPAVEQKDASFTSTAPSGLKNLISRVAADGKGVVVEVWGSSGVLQELVVPACVHGTIYNDGWFSRGAAWSPDESQLLYVAEVPPQEKTPEWGSREGSKDCAAPKGWRGQAAFEDDWGELNTGKRPPALFLLDLRTGTISQVQGLPPACSAGQPIWAPDGGSIVFVAWPHEPSNFQGAGKKLGVVYCFNRPCALYRLHLTEGSSAEPLTEVGGSAFMPAITPDGASLIFLSQQAAVTSGVHNATSALCSLPWPPAGQAPTTVVPVVQAPASPTTFPGLYSIALVDNPFLSNTQLLLTSQWRSSVAILQVDLTTGQVAPITPLDPPATWSLLAVHRGLVAASCSSPSSPPVLMLGSQADGGSWTWQAVEEVTQGDDCWGEVAELISGVQYEVLQVQPSGGEGGPAFEAIAMRPKGAAGPLPTVLTPHGGPHTAYSANYYMPYLPLLAAGYCILAVNYRGSTGFGEAALQSLPGKIGTQDVEDCVTALDTAVAAGYCDPQRVAVIGGSHGGFLTGHLLGQHPDRFCCGVLRNPVCNLSFMAGSTDIPDWTFVEAFGSQEGRKRYTAMPTPEVLARLFDVSPAAHLEAVRAPMAFMLGAKDRRVPMQDALQYVSALRAHGVETRVIVFPEDTHALDKPQTEFEQWLNALWWLRKYVPSG